MSVKLEKSRDNAYFKDVCNVQNNRRAMKDQVYNEKLLEETVSYISHCVGLLSQKDTLQFRWIDNYGVCCVTATF